MVRRLSHSRTSTFSPVLA
ncbi:hypothetical protein LINPERPRIM_LOCUS21385 [Linum perenne]